MTGGKDKPLNEAVSISDNLEKVIDDGTNIELSFFGKEIVKTPSLYFAFRSVSFLFPM